MQNGSHEEDTTYHEQSKYSISPRTVLTRGVATHATQANECRLFGALTLGHPALLAWNDHRLVDFLTDTGQDGHLVHHRRLCTL